MNDAKVRQALDLLDQALNEPASESRQVVLDDVYTVVVMPTGNLKLVRNKSRWYNNTDVRVKMVWSPTFGYKLLTVNTLG